MDVNEIFLNNLNKIIRINDVSCSDFKKVGISRQAIYSWKSGRTKPTIESLGKIAKYFNIEPYLLLKDNDNNDYGDIIHNVVNNTIFKNTNLNKFNENDFTDDEIKEIENYIKFVKIKRKFK